MKTTKKIKNITHYICKKYKKKLDVETLGYILLSIDNVIFAKTGKSLMEEIYIKK